MSAMSASSGLMPLSLISEHKAAQGGPPPVQQLAFDKHSLVQAPKPTPNGMEPSPPLAPVLPPAQPEPQPSLPCGGVSESAEENHNAGIVPEAEPTPPPVVPAPPSLVEEPAAGEPAPEPPSAPSAPALQVQEAEAACPPSVEAQKGGVPDPKPDVEAPVLEEQPQPPAAVPPEAKAAPDHPEEQKPAAEAPPAAEVVAAPPTPAPAAPAQPAAASPAQPASGTEPQPTDQEALPKVSEDPASQTKTEKELLSQAPAQTPSAGRPPKRTKAATSNEKKSAPAAATPVAENEKGDDDKRTKRKRLPTQVYQSPIPEENIIAKISKIDKTPAVDDKLIVFYRNEFLAVRNAEGSFYVCQAMQNVYKSSGKKIRIRWLSQVQNTDHYSPDFYDTTEFDCILTNLNLERIEKNKYRLPEVESQRTQSILKRAIDVENGITPAEEATVTEEHPDGLDLSLYRNEDQLKTRKSNKTKGNKKKVKKSVTEPAKKGSREIPKRNKSSESKKSTAVAQSQSKRLVGRVAKVDKPVVQRIVAAKKMGRRKVAGKTSSPPAGGKSSPPATAPAKEAPAKKKEPAPRPAPPAKRKNADHQPTPAVPEKKPKRGASKTRSGVAGGPSQSGQQSSGAEQSSAQPTRSSRRSASSNQPK